MDESTQSKACARCGSEKVLSDFGVNRANRDGLQYHCKACVKVELAAKTPEQKRRKREQNAAYMARQRALGPDGSAWTPERQREWRAANPERAREYRANFRTRSPEKFLAIRERGREADRARSSAWVKANPEWNRDRQHRRRALMRGTSTGPIDFAALWTGMCPLCGVEIDQGVRYPDPMSKSIDHIVPLARGGSHTQDNLQWTHLTCNLRKYVQHNSVELSEGNA